MPQVLPFIASSFAADPARIRVACVGDSITYGSKLANREADCYPAVLGRALGEGFEVRNFGVPGATALREGNLPYRDQPAFTAATEFTPQIVILLLGTNDTKGRNWRHQSEFARDLGALIDHFAGLAAHPQIRVCLPPPMFGFLRAANNSVLERGVIPLIRQVAREKGIPVIDLNAALAGRRDGFPDGVHPNAAGAIAIAETVLSAVQKRVESAP